MVGDLHGHEASRVGLDLFVQGRLRRQDGARRDAQGAVVEVDRSGFERPQVADGMFKLGGDLRESLALTLFKLAAHPAAVWLLATYVFPLDPTWRAVAVVVAALPVGANVFVLAQSYNIYVARAASAILISTILSVFTVSLLMVVFAPTG